MKRIFTLLWLTLTAFTFKANAQGTICNAEFAVQFINNNTVKFNPVIVVGAPTVNHTWNFGDGSPVDNTVSPTHTYALPGTYAVVHTVVVLNQNGVPVCTQSFTKTVIITAPCNLVVDFSWNATAANPLKIEFHNLSVPLSNTDSITWNFGDNTSSHDVNPVHTYANAGTYNVCLIIKKNLGPNTTPCIKYICKTVIVQAPCNLIADFAWAATQTNPLKIEFHNTSIPSSPADSVKWTFGDGTSVSGVQGDPNVANPVHTYTQPGIYTVCIRVKKNNTTGTPPCVSEKCKTVVVYQPCNLVVDFSWTATAANPLKIEFHNLSVPLSNTDSIKWTFGDGTSSSDVNPVHTYNVPGTYTVCLRIMKLPATGSAPCVREICKTIVVHSPCNLQAYFSSQPDPTHPLRIKFTNLSAPSSPSDSVRWTFGDGTSVSGLQSDPNVANPTHDYAQAGNYVVCLRVKKNLNTTPAPCVAEICKTVYVQQPCNNIQVNWSWQLDQVNPRKVYFTNLTVATTSGATATWYFGDGTSATSWNAVHEYAQPGRYYVCLKIQFGPNCIKDKCDSILIPVSMPPCNNQSNFSVLSTSSNSQTFTFIPAFQNSAAQYTWTFGDGTGSHDMITTHHYTQPGTYTACLTVWRGPNCASTTCKTVQVTQQINCDSVHVNYTYQSNPQVPNKIHFYANANVPIIDQTWTITKLPLGSPGTTVTLHQNNPTYLFQDTGYYKVCLRAVTLGGCVKEICKTIHITQVSNACLLQAYPNPATNVVNVNVTLTQAGMIDAYVYNSLNVLVKEKHQLGVPGNNVVNINVNDLPAGLYRIKLIYQNHVCYALFQKL